MMTSSTTAGPHTASIEPAAYSALLGVLADAYFADVPEANDGVTGRTRLGRMAEYILDAGWRPAPPVISGDVPTVTATLDTLPVGTVLACDEAGENLLYVKRASGMGFDVWREDGRSNPVDSDHIARHRVPVTVLREGAGA